VGDEEVPFTFGLRGALWERHWLVRELS